MEIVAGHVFYFYADEELLKHEDVGYLAACREDVARSHCQRGQKLRKRKTD